MRRSIRGRALAAIAVVLGVVFGFAGVVLAASSQGQLHVPTRAEVQTAVMKVERAVELEQAALEEIGNRKIPNAQTAVSDSADELKEAGAPFAPDVAGPQVSRESGFNDIAAARTDDQFAMKWLDEDKPDRAPPWLDDGLKRKAKALDKLRAFQITLVEPVVNEPAQLDIRVTKPSGGQATETFTNRGPEPGTVTPKFVPRFPPFSIVKDQCSEKMIGPMKRCKIILGFKPITFGGGTKTYKTKLIIDWKVGSNKGTIKIPVKATETIKIPPPPPPKRTSMGSLSNGTGGALAYSIETNTTANAFELTLAQGNSITGTSTPPGFSCTDTGNVEQCKNGIVQPNTPVTGSFDHTAAIAANCDCVQVAFSADNGTTWFANATLTGPQTESPPTVSISEDDTWAWDTHGRQAYICVNVRTTPAQSFVSADITGPNGYHATTNGKWPLGTDGSRQLSAPATQPGDYTKTLTVYDTNGNQTATATKTFTVAPPGTDGPATTPPCPKPTE